MLLQGMGAPDALEAIAAAMGDELERSKWSNRCPIATTALERAAADDAIRAATDDVFRGWETLFASRLARDGMAKEDAARLGVLAVSSLEGALILSRSQLSAAPLRDCARGLADLLRNART